jgi:hypothetical protein
MSMPMMVVVVAVVEWLTESIELRVEDCQELQTDIAEQLMQASQETPSSSVFAEVVVERDISIYSKADAVTEWLTILNCDVRND